MKLLGKILLVAAAGAACVLGWGFWYSVNHAVVYFSVNDYALKTPRRLYGSPHDVSLVLHDAANNELAVARSVEPQGYILAVHPVNEIGTCEQYENSQSRFSACYTQYSSWLSGWAARVSSADVRVGTCELHAVPVTVYRSNGEWPVWWVPLPHVGGLPREYFSFSFDIDSRTCSDMGNIKESL